MVEDLSTLIQTYQALTLEIYEGKSLISVYRSTGGDMDTALSTHGVRPLLPHILPKQKLILHGVETKVVLQHSGTYIRLTKLFGEEVILTIQIPLYIPLPLPIPLESTHTTSPPPEETNVGVPDHSNTVEVSQKEDDTDSFGQEFSRFFGVRDAYVAGAMAGGIASVELVRAMSIHGRLAFFGAGGLSVDEIEKGLGSLSSLQTPFGCNLLCNIYQPQDEERVVDLLLAHRISIISASAYSQLTPALVRYRLHGIYADVSGDIMAPNRVVAKVSHPIVAKLFLSPPPPKIVAYLHTSGAITKEQAEFASKISMADAITVEADSGGHTDGRPLSVILPSIKKMAEKQQHRVFVGAAGGLGTPKAMAGAAALGADYLLLGSIHQSCVEAGTSGMVKQMLAKATITDTDMGIAPDMFERGAKVQVLTAGSLYAPRSRKLRELYLRYNSWAEIPVREQSKLEKLLFQASYEEIWEEVVLYWSKVDSRQLERAERIPKHKLALFFRWYLGQSSRWARLGIDERKKDFQVWCGPSMGAFNEWAVDNYVSEPHMRTVVAVSDLLWKQFKTLL